MSFAAEEEVFAIPAHVNPYEILVLGDSVESYLESESPGSALNRGKKVSVSRNKPEVRAKHVHQQQSSDSHQLYTTDGQPANKDIVKKYLKQVKESKGFNIIDYPGHIQDVTHIVPRQDVIDNRNKYPEDYDKIMDMAALAIESYNKDHSANFKVANIKKLNEMVYEDGDTNYITFTAVNVGNQSQESGFFNRIMTNSSIVMTTFVYWFIKAESLEDKLKKLKSPQNLKATGEELRSGRFKTFQAKVWDGIGTEREVLFCNAK